MGARQAIAAFAQGGDAAAASALYLLTSCPDHSVSTAEAVTWGMGQAFADHIGVWTWALP